VLVREAFWRKSNNPRELADWSGLAPTPWASGAVSRDQGIAKTDPAIFRSHMLQIAWRWLQHQPQSRMSQWFIERTAPTVGFGGSYRGARPQAAGRALALRNDGPRADRRHHRLKPCRVPLGATGENRV
jgi:hypothetical protein